ncbi:MAG: transporter substrate-binding domain-containing protein [Pseudomonadales bacterium]|nr:transporter substrate-binding domain-containing protein [Pseudomonadales bacterium]NRA16695.1 transporter substrate-binding domain-containing protein [Oceanospirillaceae bacterium]
MKSTLAWQLIVQIPIICLLLMLSAYANSSEEDVGMFVMEQIPYGFQRENGENTGILLDVLNEIRDSSGIGLPIQTLPLKRLLATLLKDMKSCTLVADSPVIIDNLDLVEPIGYTLTAGILPVAGVVLKDYSNLKGMLIAVPLGIQFDEKFHSDHTLNKVSTLQYIDAIKMMQAGRVHAVAGAISILKYIATQEGLNAQFFDRPLIIVEKSMYLACSFKLTKSQRTKLQQAVISLRSNGKTQYIFDSYLGQPIE